MLKLIGIAVLFATPLAAESLIATRVIRAQTILSANDVTLVDAAIPGALTESTSAIGLEARVTLYPGRAIRAADIGPPALLERNQIVTLVYTAGGLGITTEGRALDRAGVGEVVRVMNLSSRTIVAGRVAPDGAIHVGSTP